MEGQSIIRRRRPAKSCIECRRRKVKCNREDPCNHCTISAGSRCSYKQFRTQEAVVPVHHPHAALSSLTSKSTSASHPSPLVAQQDCSNSGNTSRDGTPTALQQLSSPRTTTGAVVGPFGLAGTTLTYLHTATRVDSSYDNMPASEEPYHPMQNLNPFSLTASDSGQEPGTPRELVANQVGLQASQLVLMKSRVMRWSHLMFMAHEVSLGV